MKKIIITSILLVMLLTGCGCNKKEAEKENKPNTNEPTVENPEAITNEEMIKDQTVENLQFTNTGLVYDGSMTTLTSQVTNISDQPVELTKVMATINYKDENDVDRVLEMEVYFGESLEAGETRSVLSNVNVDLRKSTNITYRIVRE